MTGSRPKLSAWQRRLLENPLPSRAEIQVRQRATERRVMRQVCDWLRGHHDGK